MITDNAVFRDGTPIEKGVALSREYLDNNQELFTKYLNHWILYPDLFLDTIQDSEDAKHFHLLFYQRIALRAAMRYRYMFWTACRATSKSFTASPRYSYSPETPSARTIRRTIPLFVSKGSPI